MIATPTQTLAMIISARTRASGIRIRRAEETLCHQWTESGGGNTHYADTTLAEGPDADVGCVVKEVDLVAFESGKVGDADEGCY